MNTDLLSRLVIAPALLWLGPRYASPQAETMLIAIAWQESQLKHRVQMDGGPARGFWQFERNGGVKGVLSHHATRELAINACFDLVVEPTKEAAHAAIAQNDLLACIFARLLLFSDPYALPTKEAEGWNYYERTWRPGKPHPEKWGEAWDLATREVYG